MSLFPSLYAGITSILHNISHSYNNYSTVIYKRLHSYIISKVSRLLMIAIWITLYWYSRWRWSCWFFVKRWRYCLQHVVAMADVVANQRRHRWPFHHHVPVGDPSSTWRTSDFWLPFWHQISEQKSCALLLRSLYIGCSHGLLIIWWFFAGERKLYSQQVALVLTWLCAICQHILSSWLSMRFHLVWPPRCAL